MSGGILDIRTIMLREHKFRLLGPVRLQKSTSSIGEEFCEGKVSGESVFQFGIS